MTKKKDNNNHKDSLDIDSLGAYRLGPWRIEPSQGKISQESGEQRLEPKVMALLCVLARAYPHVLSREAVFAELWPNQVVGDDALSRCLLNCLLYTSPSPRDFAISRMPSSA